ncbi:alkaline phosphatase family protein [Verrucomicrobiaceae bacterium 227]
MKIVLLILSFAMARGEERVIVISVDGLRPDAVTTLGPGLAPNFHRLRKEAAFTDNARTDYHYTTTLPNHTCMVTSRPVLGPGGHGLTVNSGGVTTNVHVNGYTAGMFDVAHDHGFSTALFAGKIKFLAFQGSYSETTGALDVTGEDNGRNKLDHALVGASDAAVVADFTASMLERKWGLSMLHLRAPDAAGHGYDWDLTPGSRYLASIVEVDGYLGQIFEMIDANVEILGIPHLILTTDHGGTRGTYTHTVPTIPTSYTIPFYVWGPGVKEGADLYGLNPGLVDPGEGRPMVDSPGLPVRSAMVGNLALQLMGLPPIPGSSLNLSQQFRVNDPPDFQSLHPGLDPDLDANGNGLTNFADYLLGADPFGPDRPDLRPGMAGKSLVLHLRNNVTDVKPLVEISADGREWGPLLEGATFLRRRAQETTSGVRVTLEVPALLPGVLLRQVMEPAW